MEARTEVVRGRPLGLPRWLLGFAPLIAIGLMIGLFVALGAPGLGDRLGPPAEELMVEKTVLRPGEIELSVRNDGPDAVGIEQVAINDGFVPFAGRGEVGRLEATTLTIPYPWVEEEAYELFILTSAGGTIDHEIAAAVETPLTDASFFGLMTLLGVYVGVIPVAIGMLWLPFVRRIPRRWIQAIIAFTVGLLAFLGFDALLEGIEFGEAGSQAFGGTALVFLGAAAAYLTMAGVDARLARSTREVGFDAFRLAFLVALGIGLHNLGEGVAIGAAYAGGALALGAFLVVGFALHNTTEGLAIVAPMANRRARFVRLAGLGLLAGAPVILGAWIGAAAFSNAAAALLFGIGVGAIAHVVVQLVPSMRDDDGAALHPVAVGGLLAGIAVLYATGLLISV